MTDQALAPARGVGDRQVARPAARPAVRPVARPTVRPVARPELLLFLRDVRTRTAGTTGRLAAVPAALRPSRLTQGAARVGRPLRRRPDALVVAALVAVVGTLQTIGVFSFPALADDEGTYVAQAAAVRGGELAHYTYWYDHPPLGWAQLALLDWVPQQLLPDVQTVAASRLVLVLATCATAALTYVLALRLGLGRPFAAGAVLIGFASPLAVVMHRQVYLDNIATPWVLLSLVLVLDRRRRLLSYVLAGLAFAAAVGSKETTVVLAPVLMWVLFRQAHPSTRWFALAGFTGSAALVAFYPLMALMRNELLPGEGHVSLYDAIVFQLVSRPGSGAMWDAGSPSNLSVLGWLYYDPWLVVLGLVGLPVALAVRRLRPLGLMLLLIVLVALKPGGYLPAMYVIVALPFLGLSVAAAAQVVGGGLARLVPRVARLPLGLAAAAVAAGLLTTAWTPALTMLMTTETNAERVAAERWVAANAPDDAVVLVDDVSWAGLVQKGDVDRADAVWFYKLDTDPSLRVPLPDGWRDIDLVVSTDQMRNAVAGDPSLVQAAGALENSQVVATFGSGGNRVDVLRVQP